MISNKEKQQQKLSLLIAFIIGFFVLLVVRLFDLQVMKGQDFRLMADENRFFSIRIPAERGVVFDRYNQPLVWNSRRYYKLKETDSLFSEKQFLDHDTALATIASQSSTVGYDLMRLYRFPKALSHTLGYVGAVDKDDLISDKSLNIADQIGKMGIEKNYDEIIRGLAGKEVFEIDALGKKRFFSKTQLASAGYDLETSLDPYISKISLEALGQQPGVVLVADANTGKLLTLVSSPSFDSNTFSQLVVGEEMARIKQQQIQQFLQDQRQVFFNRAISGVYPPGSVFKLITAIAGLENKAFDISTTVKDEGILKVGEYEYANWYFTQYGRTDGEISLIRALARSNDIYFYKAAEWIGANDLAEMSRIFGFDKATGINLGNESTGTIPDPKWKERVKGERWYLGNTYHMGIGQGDILVTPLQVLQMVQAFANKGKMCSPTIISNKIGQCQELGVQEENINHVLRGMLAACSTGGTAFPFFKDNEEFNLPEVLNDFDPNDLIKKGAMACKTGTAEFGGANEKGYRKTHGWFVSIVGVNPEEILVKAEGDKSASESSSVKPNDDIGESDNNKLREKWLEGVLEKGFPKKLVFVVLVESEDDHLYKEGSKDAAPVVKEILDWIEGE